MNVLDRPLPPGRRRRSSSTASRSSFRLPARRHRGRPRHGPPALHAGALADRHREHHPRPRPTALPPAPRPLRRRDRRAGGDATACASTRKRTIWQLSVGEQQRVEILKMLYRGAQVLILDEPTAVLTPQEIEELFRTLRVDDRRAAIRSSSSATSSTRCWPSPTGSRCMRAARSPRPACPRPATTTAELAALMVGREVLESLERSAFAPGEVVLLGARRWSAENDRGLPALRGVSLDVRAGEIVGIAGVAGNGQSELAQVDHRAAAAPRPVIDDRRPTLSSGRSARDAIRQRGRPRARGPHRRRAARRTCSSPTT